MRLIILLSALVLLISCNSESNRTTDENTSNYLDAVEKMNPTKGHEVTVLEVIDVGTYTYLKLDEGGKEYWGAITSYPAVVGKKYYYKKGMEMNNFNSKQLDRTFESIIFIQGFSDQPFINQNTITEQSRQEKTTSVQNNKISIDMPEDGINLEELFKNKGKYSGKTVIVKGVVVKMNQQIMGKNWIHIQDGTSYENAFDLTITTTEDINFSLEETITVEGIITLNKDFGAGYFYDLIMEEGHVIK